MGKNKYVLVLGSKPNSKLPAVNIEHVYAANAAIKLADKYYEYGISKNDITSVTTGKQLLKKNVQDGVLNIKPGNLTSRRWEIPEIIVENLEETLITQMSDKDQKDFQKKYIGYGLYTSEFKAIYTMLKIDKAKAIKRIRNIIKHDISAGLSTGLFAILLAANDFPKHTILISGIGLKEGSHFYDKNLTFPLWRAVLDKEMVKYFSTDLKKRLISTDMNFAKILDVDLYRGETI